MNERTSKRVARIAGKVLAMEMYPSEELVLIGRNGRFLHERLKWRDIRALAASALTQAEDHAHRETLRKGKLPRGHRLIKRHKPVKRRMLHK